MNHNIRFILFIIVLSISACLPAKNNPLPGAYQTDEYIKLLRGKQIGLVCNHTSMINRTHLADSLIKSGIQLKKVFSPEHGFRGTEDAGALIENGIDLKTGLPVISLYGSKKKPDIDDFEGLDLIVFDLQDVGVRFFTYISTLFYVMEACAEQSIPLIVLDRPNPNGDYIAGPVLESSLTSFVGIVPVPVVYGLTIGELAKMINGEGWLANGIACDLTVIKLKNWNHKTTYILPVKPSPNLPNHQSVRLYPSLCLFEGTNMSIGRGTEFPFQVIGHPNPAYGSFTFMPEPIKGMEMNPKHKGKLCYGMDLKSIAPPLFTLSYFLHFYELSTDKDAFWDRPEWIKLLVGDKEFQGKVISGLSEKEIIESWQEGLSKFREKRKKYLIYDDL